MSKRGSFQIAIRGMRPSPSANERREVAWRHKIAEEIAKRVNRPLNVPADTQFELRITFYIESAQLFRAGDLDNLAKPVLDTLFQQSRPTELPTARLFTVDDGYVTSLQPAKHGVKKSSDEGADIHLKWSPQGEADEGCGWGSCGCMLLVLIALAFFLAAILFV